MEIQHANHKGEFVKKKNNIDFMKVMTNCNIRFGSFEPVVMIGRKNVQPGNG